MTKNVTPVFYWGEKEKAKRKRFAFFCNIIKNFDNMFVIGIFAKLTFSFKSSEFYLVFIISVIQEFYSIYTRISLYFGFPHSAISAVINPFRNCIIIGF